MLDGFVYAIGGWEGSSRLDTVEKYSPETNTWSSVASLKIAVTSPAVAACNGELLIDQCRCTLTNELHKDGFSWNNEWPLLKSDDLEPQHPHDLQSNCTIFLTTICVLVSCQRPEEH